MHRGGPRVPYCPGSLPFQGYQSELRSEIFMITKTFIRYSN
jgi:hypothetical protein